MDIKMKVELDCDQLIKPSELSMGKKACDICSQSHAQYTCPRCNKTYCSLSCYQSPSHLACSESFYQDEVINELKACRIDDERREKMADILKRDLERSEKETFELDDDSLSTTSSENENGNNNSSELTADEMIRAYESEATKWKPWWKIANLSQSVIDESSIQEQSLNERLVDNSCSINISNASPFLYNDIIQTTYLYIITTSVYQLDEDDFKSTSIEFDEICSAFLEAEKLLTSSNKNGLDLSSKLDFIVANLLQKENYFLKNYINKQVLTRLLDELVSFCRHPVAQKKVLSHLYTLFENSLDKKALASLEKQTEIEKPINVFHFNKQRPNEKVKKDYEKKSRVEILSKPKQKQQTSANAEKNKLKLFNATKKETKTFLKKLEYYFKWLTTNLSSVECESTNVCLVVTRLRDSIWKEIGEFDEQKSLIDSNMNFIRKKVASSNKKLIEEL